MSRAVCGRDSARTRRVIRCFGSGASAFLAEIDGNTYLDKDGKLEQLKRHGKFRGPEFDPVPFRLGPVESTRLRDGDGEPVESLVAVPLDGPSTRDPEAKAPENTLLCEFINNPERALSH
jgi:hypothetical protein